MACEKTAAEDKRAEIAGRKSRRPMFRHGKRALHTHIGSSNLVALRSASCRHDLPCTTDSRQKASRANRGPREGLEYIRQSTPCSLRAKTVARLVMEFRPWRIRIPAFAGMTTTFERTRPAISPCKCRKFSATPATMLAAPALVRHLPPMIHFTKWQKLRDALHFLHFTRGERSRLRASWSSSAPIRAAARAWMAMARDS